MERKKRKKDKKTVLSTAAVLTTNAIKAIVAAREAVEEAKRNAREQRKRSKIKREEAAILYKEQVKARKRLGLPHRRPRGRQSNTSGSFKQRCWRQRRHRKLWRLHLG
jgi:hypothetical protein